MIFLLKNGKYEIVPDGMSNTRFRKYYRDRKDLIQYIAIENFTSKKSDCFVFIKPDHFDPVFIPMTLKYLVSYKGIDDPVSRDNVYENTVYIDSIYKKYSIAPLLIQLARFSGSNHGYSPFETVLLDVKIKTVSEEFHWTYQSEKSLEKFLKKRGLMVDTSDTFRLDRSKVTDKIFGQWHSYLNGGTLLYSSNGYQYFYFHKDGTWRITDVPPLKYSERCKYEKYGEWSHVGIVIPNSELIYVMARKEALVFSNVAYLDIEGTSAYDGRKDLPNDSEIVFNRHIECNTLADILHACLIFPQVCDLDTIIYDISYSYIKLNIVMKDHRVYAKIFNVERKNNQPGYHFDLFLMILRVMVEGRLIQ